MLRDRVGRCLSGLLLGSFIAATVVSAAAVAGGAQFINVFDKSAMTEVLPGTLVAELYGDKIGVMTFFAGGASAPVSDGKSHYHHDEHVWFQFAGESDYWIDFGDAKTRELNGLGAGVMMHVPMDQQHRGGHGVEDHYMAMVLTPPGATTIIDNDSGGETICTITGTTACGEFLDSKTETIDLHDEFEFASAEFTVSVGSGVLTRRGKLGPLLGQEALLISGSASPGELLTGGKAPEEEVAMVYQGRVKVTGCGESRELVRGDLFYCDGPLTYSALGGEESQVLRVFSPAEAGFFIPGN